MTICIGAICDNGESAVLIADKMITHTALGNYKQENGETKIHKFSENCYVMNSGDLKTAKQIYDVAREDRRNVDDHYKIANAYKTCAIKNSVEKILYPRGFDSLDSFMSKKNEMNDALVLKLDTELVNYKIDTTVMTVFFDTKLMQYQMGLIEGDRVYKKMNQPGFCSIGIKFQIVEFLILQSGFSINLSLFETKDILTDIKHKVQPHFDGIGESNDIVCLKQGVVIETTLR